MNHFGKVWAGLALAALIVPAAGQNASDTESEPAHLRAARELVKNLHPASTSYKHGKGVVSWKGSKGATLYESHTDCSGFLNHLLAHSYGHGSAALKRWFGKDRPTADVYYDKISGGIGFTPIPLVKDVRPGDILAVKYLTCRGDTGHVMLVVGVPKKTTPGKPLKAGTEQWLVSIIDSSKSGHGPTDTRHARGPHGKDQAGLGQGVVRLYANRMGKVAGFTWSTRTRSKFLAPEDEPLVIGRLQLDFKP